MNHDRAPQHLRLRRGAYLLPSVFTIGNILLGFYAVTLGVGSSFQRAAVMIFIAGILDALDGRIARLSGTASEFGREFDSLADVLTFGAAPALLSFLWGLGELGRIGWLVPLFFLVCTATRLARFNVQTRVVDSRYFVGLPAPAAAAGIASILFFAPDHQWRAWVSALLLIALLSLGGLMISTFRYHSFKRLDLKRRWSYRAALPLALVLLVVAYHPPAAFLAVATLYTLSGPSTWLWGYLHRKGGEPSPSTDPPSHEAHS
ncbi:MAG TPA: CDP-diacylglycerol--serine O-phosphatidyltransferase [Thermoanaerobaculia bacterium]|nr:CDP-diacylglycerol--serine O-phosphatidyltransferase [Thermoanaerobaculia bacterium]